MELRGFIIDGTGRPGFYGQVTVEGDRITEVEPVNPLDATDQTILTPGFIDCHSHSDAYLILEPWAPSKIMQGITTEINGQCGGSIAPRYGEARLSSDWKALLGDRLIWHTLAEYREVFEQVQPAINSVQFIGHNTLRSSVIGYKNAAASPDDLKRMIHLLEEALDQGGWGFSTGLIYPPGRYSTPAEVEALAAVTAKRGGYYATHMRSEGDRLLESISEVLDLVRKTGIRAEISHLKTSGERNWHKIDAVLKEIDAAVAAGELLGADRYPYCAAGTDLDIVIEDDGTIADRDWSKVMIGGTWHSDNKCYSGKLVSDLAAERGMSPPDLVREIVRKDGGKTGAFFFGMSEDNLDRILTKDWVVPGSDASLRAPWGPLGADWPHPRAYGTMPEFYRRLLKLGFSREQAIARMTSVPCDRFCIRNRGRILKGEYADIVVFDERSFVAESEYARPHQFADGIRLVMVNGVAYTACNMFKGPRAGRFLER